jgi:hypothetical protein
MFRRVGLIGLGVAALATIGVAAPAAGASGLARLAVPTNTTSTIWAGYQLASPPAAVSASVKFVVPSLTCKRAESGVAPGVFDFTSSSLSAAAVISLCEDGAPAYYGVVAADGNEVLTTFSPAPGDAMVATLSESASASSVKLTDTTQTQTQTLSGSGDTNVTLLEGMDSVTDSGNEIPVARFPATTFKAAKMDRGTPAAAGAAAVDMESGASVLQIQTGPLSAAGNRWKETFKHA